MGDEISDSIDMLRLLYSVFYSMVQHGKCKRDLCSWINLLLCRPCAGVSLRAERSFYLSHIAL